jgi:hypothetical protein
MDTQTTDAFKQAYRDFLAWRQKVLASAIEAGVTKSRAEPDPAFLLRVARWAAKHWRGASQACFNIDQARSAGRSALEAAKRAWEDSAAKDYMMRQGYSDAARVYMFTAPLDAIGAKQLLPDDADALDGQTAKSWLHVATMNHAVADETNMGFLREYIRNRAEASEGDEDPFPSSDMAEIVRSIKCTPAKDVPGEFRQTCGRVQELFLALPF